MADRDGSYIDADIVIAADGAHSRLRPYLTPIVPVYSGVTIVEGAVHDSAIRIPRIHALLNGGKIFALSGGRSLIVSSKGDGSLVFYTGCRTDEHWSHESGIDFTDKTQVLAWFKEEFAGWDDIWEELFINADGPFIPRPQYCMPTDQTWTAQPGLTMLGDAAHLMPPYAGEGVNMAMLDALELAQHLTSDEHPDTLSAIAAYETEMCRRAGEMADMTLQSTEALHSEGALDFMLGIISGHEG